MFNDLGQSLLEITVSIGVAAVIIVALTIVTITGLRNSEFAQDQAQATKLSQDWLEQVRSISDRNGYINSVYNPWNQVGSIDCSPGPDCTYIIGTINGNNCVNSQGSGPVCLVSSNSPQAVSGTPFSRLLTVRDCNTAPDSSSNCSGHQRKVTSVTSWSDPSGAHQSELITILTYP